MYLQKIKRWLLILFIASIAVFAIAAGVLEFYIFPNIGRYKSQIASQLSQSLHQTVNIADINVRWRGIHPQFKLQDIVLYDKQKRPALKLSEVTTHLSWSSLFVLSPSLVSLSVDSPNLTIRRTATGEVFLAGISMSTQGNPDFANWLLEQRRIKITHATITWIDEQRQAPPLLLNDLNVELLSPVWQRLLGRHNVHIDTLISTGTRQRITVDAVLVGHDISKPDTWHGEATLITPAIDLAVWHPWLDIPLDLHRGQGSITATFTFNALKLQQLAARINLNNLSLTSPHHTQVFEAKSLRGELQWRQENIRQSLHLKHLYADISPGLQLFDTTGQLSWTPASHEGQFNTQKLIIDNIAALTAWVPTASVVTDSLEHIAPAGTIERIETHWKYTNGSWQDYGLTASLAGISSQPYEHIPGLTNWSGELEISPHQGLLHLDTRNAKIDTAGLLRWPLPIDHLEGDVRWEHNGEKTLISTHNLKFENSHLALQLVADYQLGAIKGDTIQLAGQIERGDAKFAPFYYPVILGETTLHWLDTSILSGQVKHGEVIVKGRVKDFPFVNAKQQSDPELGLFRVTAQVEHTSLEYGLGWPTITDIEALLKFEGKRMDIAVKKGQTVDQNISQAQVEIPQLDADWPMLNITATANGTIEKGIKFVNSSPVKQVTMGFTESLQASGEGNLHLALQVPLNDVEQARFQGDYTIKNGHLSANPASGMPEMNNINGHLKFNEKSVQVQAAQLMMFDSPATFSLSTRNDKSIMIQTSGKMTDAALRKLDNNLLTRALHGTADWKANLLIQPPSLRIDIFSSLTGMSIDMPAPLNKAAESPANLVIRVRQENSQQDKMVVHYDQWIHANLLRSHTGQETQISAGEISINTPMRPTTGNGINIHANFPKLNVDDWLEYINQPQASSTTAGTHVMINSLELTADTLQVFNRDLHQIKLNTNPTPDQLHLAIQSQEMAGDVDWISGKPSKLIAKLNYLRIPRSMDTDNSPPKEVQHSTSTYPEVEISAQEFQFGDKQLGSLDLKAVNSGENWIVQKLNLTNPDSQLAAEGNWRNSVRNPQTMLKFNLTSNNLGKTLQRFQPGEMIKGGNGNLSGQIGWPGSPHEFAVERLDGNLNMQLEKGQILKVKPGVGRLLGLLSLQSLPRRLSLDFHDLFSQGFAFDKISCTANMQDGILRSDDLFMTGPAAEAKIKGETNLKTETQKLKVKVVPHITDSISLAALAGGPIVGVAAFVAQKLLKDPLNKISSSEYTIGGTWDNPQELNADNPSTENQTNQTIIKH